MGYARIFIMCICMLCIENVQYDYGHGEKQMASFRLQWALGVIMPIYQMSDNDGPRTTILFILLMNLQDLNFQSSG